MCLKVFSMILYVVSSYVRLCFGKCLKNVLSENVSEIGLNKKEMTFSAPCYLIRPSVVVGTPLDLFFFFVFRSASRYGDMFRVLV